MVHLIKIDHLTGGTWHNPDFPPEVETDYINLAAVATITPLVDGDSYSVTVSFVNGDNARYDVHPSTYDNLVIWLDKAVIFDGGMVLS